MVSDFTWGVLGTARIARTTFIPAIKKTPGHVVGAVASRDGARAAAFAAANGVPVAHDSYEALLNDPSIDAVYIPLPNNMHVHWSQKSMQAGKHVLCEKPLAMSADEARILRVTQAQTRRIIVEGFMVHHHPQWKAVLDLVRAGRIGDVRAVQTTFSYSLDDPDNIRSKLETGGGGLYDIGCYAITTARAIFDDEPDRVIAAFNLDPETGIDRLTSAIVEFPGGRHLVFTCGTTMMVQQSMRILGERGHMTLQTPFNPPPRYPARIVLETSDDITGANAQHITIAATDQFSEQALAFARLARSGSSGKELDDALLNMMVIDALFRSGKSGQWEALP